MPETPEPPETPETREDTEELDPGDLDSDDELATRPHRKLDLPAEPPAGELFEDTHDDVHDFENQLTPPPRFLDHPPEPVEDDETRPHVLDDEDE